MKTFNLIKEPHNILHSILDQYVRPPTSRIFRQKPYEYELPPAAKTNRYLRSFFPYCIRKKY